MDQIAINLRANKPACRTAEPATCGVPFPKGLVRDRAWLRLVDGYGSEQPLQTRVLDHWADGSARWVLCDWRATIDGEASYRIRVLEPEAESEGDKTNRLSSSPSLSASGSGDKEAVGENEARRQVEAIGSRMIASDIIRVVSDGREYSALPDFDWFIDDSGPLRVSVCERGTITDEGRHLARYTLRTHHFANGPVVRVHLTINNPNRAEHPGGLWDLGDSGSIEFDELVVRLHFPMSQSGSGRISVEPGKALEPFTGPMELLQESSGGENWNNHNHLSRSRIAPHWKRGYSLSATSGERSGLRASPIVIVTRDDLEASVGIPYFWENFPKRQSVDLNGIAIELFPRNLTFTHELQGGEQKEHVFFVAFGRDTITDEPLEWTRDPLVVSVDHGPLAAFTQQWFRIVAQ